MQSPQVEPGIYSIQSIQITNAGAGYTVAPTITITGGGGSGAAATCSIETSLSGISSFVITNPGSGYVNSPIVTIGGSVGSGQTASVISGVGTNQTISSLRIINPGVGYTVAPTVTIAPPPVTTGIGTYIFNEIVVGSNSQAEFSELKHGIKILMFLKWEPPMENLNLVIL